MPGRALVVLRSAFRAGAAWAASAILVGCVIPPKAHLPYYVCAHEARTSIARMVHHLPCDLR